MDLPYRVPIFQDSTLNLSSLATRLPLPPLTSYPKLGTMLHQHVHGDVGAPTDDDDDVGSGPAGVVYTGKQGGAEEVALALAGTVAAVDAGQRGAAGYLDEEMGVV